jgi:hypothetical protein
MATNFSQKVIDKALSERCWISKIDANHYRVTPRTKRDPKNRNRERGIYIVAYTLDSHGLPTIESCRDSRTHEQCKGFKFNDGECYHGATVSIHVLRPRIKEENAA